MSDNALALRLELRQEQFSRDLARAKADIAKRFGEMEGSSTRASKRIQKDMETAASAAQKAFGSLKGFATGFVGGLAAGAVSEFTTAIKGAITSVADLNAQAQQAGVGVEAFQRLQAAAIQTKVGTDALVDGLKELQLRTDEFVVTGSGSAAESLRRLGYTTDDLKARLRDVPSYFLDIIGRVQQLDQAARIRVMDELFGGTGGEQFVRLVDLGADGVRKIGDEAQASGRVIDAELVQRAADLDAQFHVISETIRVNMVGAIVAAAGEMSKLQQLGASWFRFMQEQRGEVLSPGAMIGDLAGTRPLPVWDRRENEDRTNRARPGDYSPPPIPQDNLPPIPYRPPNLLDYDPNPVARSGGSGAGSRAASAGAARTERDAVAALISSLEEELRLVGATDAERAVSNNLRSAGADATDAQKAKIRELTAAIQAESAAQDRANNARQEFVGMGTDALKGLIGDLMQGKNAADAFAGAVERLGQKLIDLALDKLGNSIGSTLVGVALGAPAAGAVFAEGGDIRGPGTGTSDSIPIWASNGEFMVNAKAAAKHRRLLHAINSGAAGFAAGGEIGTLPGFSMPASRPGETEGARPIVFTNNVTVNANGGTPEQNNDLAEKIAGKMEGQIRGVIADELRRQMRPGNMANRRS